MNMVLGTPNGLHARPAGRIVQAVQGLRATVLVCYGGQEADARSVIELMALAAQQGSALQIRAHGQDARQALMIIAQLCSCSQYNM